MIGTKLYIRAVRMRTEVSAHCGAQMSVRIAVRKQKKPKTSTDVGAHAHRNYEGLSTLLCNPSKSEIYLLPHCMVAKFSSQRRTKIGQNILFYMV